MIRVFSAAFLIAAVTGGTAYVAISRMRSEDCTRCALRRAVRTQQAPSCCTHEQQGPSESQGNSGEEPIVLLPQAQLAPNANVETTQPPRLPPTPLHMPLAGEEVSYVPTEDQTGEGEFSLDSLVTRIVESFSSPGVEPVSFETTPLPENTQVENAVPQVQMPPCPADNYHHGYPSCPYLSGHGSYPRYYPTYTPPPQK